jgi:hypothetical protein
MTTQHNPVPDEQLAAALRPLLEELEGRLIIRGKGAQAAAIVKLRTFVSVDFGVDKTLQAPVDTKTRPMFEAPGAKQ